MSLLYATYYEYQIYHVVWYSDLITQCCWEMYHLSHQGKEINFPTYQIDAETKWPIFSRLHFQMHFHDRKCSYFDWNFTHYDLVTSYGDRNLRQHWLRQWLVAWRHQTITWTNVDWSSVKSSDIHIRAISQEMPQPTITKICLKITCLENFIQISQGTMS